MQVRAKICGIRSPSDLDAALQGGADAVGFLVGQVHTSADFIAPDTAAALVARTPPFVTTVLVTHLAELLLIRALADSVPTALVQLHGDLLLEDIAHARTLLRPRKLIAKISVENESAFAVARGVAAHVDALLLDTRNRTTGQIGGTGLTHDWGISARIRAAVSCPVILAGGLTPSNVGRAIDVVRPSSVDVNSGVKGMDGNKDYSLVTQFMEAVRRQNSS